MREDTLKAALAKATPGHWSVYPRRGDGYAGIHTDSFQTTVAGTASGLSDADAEVIVLLHNNAQFILDALAAITKTAHLIAEILTEPEDAAQS